MEYQASLEPRHLTDKELVNLPIESGVIKIIVLDGVTGKSNIVNCPRHGDVITHTHAGKFDTITVHAEHRIK